VLKAHYKKHTLNFKRPSGTSRGVLTQKETFYLILESDSIAGVGIGECSTLVDLSIDHVPGYEAKLKEVCANINEYVVNPHKTLLEWPSICFGIEMAIMDLQGGGTRELFPSPFTLGKKGVYINGLIWMGSFEYMKEQLAAKLKDGFRCIKIKIGGIAFDEELELLGQIRDEYNADDLELRLDANGAFTNEEALDKLDQLSDFDIHSIEQPIKQGDWKAMQELCKKTPIPIALDEELIRIQKIEEKESLIATINPDYLILKPSLLGGFNACHEWIDMADKNGVKWWITSALESNIGLNAIAQWAFLAAAPPSEGGLPQGLGTGQLYTNNIDSPLVIQNSRLWYRGEWNMKGIINT
jgi:o-succinylbenzoate synthase